MAGCAVATVSTPLTSAVRAADAGEYELAAQLCRDVIASDASPQVMRDARVLLARLHITRLGDREAGLAQYRLVLDLYPRHHSAAEALWVLGSQAFRDGDYKQARRHFLRLVFDFGGTRFDSDARVWLAASHERLGNAAAAVDVYERFLQAYPTDPRADELQDRQRALAAGREVAIAEPATVGTTARAPRPTQAPQRETSPSVPQTMEEARVHDEAPDLRHSGPARRPDAPSEFASWTASPIFGHNPRTLMMAGGGLFGGEDLRYDMSATGANLDDAVLALGLLYYSDGAYDKAGACLAKAEELGVREIQMYTALTVCYLRSGHVSHARATFAEALRVDSRSPGWLRSFARAQLDAEAIELARLAVRILRDTGTVNDPDLEERFPPD